MTMEELTEFSIKFLRTCHLNYVSMEDALSPELAGLRLYDDPIFAVGAADDPLFLQTKDPNVVHPDACLPADLLPEARRVISFFLPFSEEICRSNHPADNGPSDAWLHARIEGQIMLDLFGEVLLAVLKAAGEQAVFPTTDPRFQKIGAYHSNWSERHVAYICGLGTFGISRSLITEKGTAGRFGSVITTAPLPVTQRPYRGPFDYCNLCGQCQKNCPAGAIEISRGVADGKDQVLCGDFVDATFLPPHGSNHRVRYGCGKCQTYVPCARGIPPKKTTP